MRTIELSGVIDERHSVRPDAPADLPPGDDIESALWMRGVAAEWADDLADLSQDIYTLEDGRPHDEAR